MLFKKQSNIKTNENLSENNPKIDLRVPKEKLVKKSYQQI